MLDQNTDRMWYVIGAVIVGAAIILIMNNAFPQLFASIGDTFKSKTEDVGKEVDELTVTDGVGPKQRNLIELGDISLRYKGTADLSEYTEHNRLTLTVDNRDSSGMGMNGGIRLRPFDLGLEPNTKYVLQYTYQKLDGTLVSFGGHSKDSTQVFSNNTVYIDGKLYEGNYHDNRSVFVGDDTAVHDVKVYFTTPNEITEVNDDTGIWIQPNRAVTSGDKNFVVVDIRDLTLTEAK